MKKRLLASWHKMKLEDFLECLEASIACTGLGRIFHLPGKIYTQVTKELKCGADKPWPIMIFEFGTHFWHGGFTH
jgi:hypothetical protein